MATEQVVPNTAEEALAAWDAGKEVQTVEMGGLGTGYEMAIQCVAFEMIRAILADDGLGAIVRHTPDGSHFPSDLGDALDAVALGADAKDPETGRCKLGGLSGAQVGAAKNLAITLVRRGYDSAREQVPDRLIFVRRQDPTELYSRELSA